MKQVFFFSLLLSIFFSCEESDKDRIARLLQEWKGKEIAFPNGMIFTKYGIDTLDYRLPESDYTVISYIDSMGCTSCKMQFHRWEQVMHKMDSVSPVSIPYLFIFHPKNKIELNYLMKRDNFDVPVWIDTEDVFNKQNQLPLENMFHAFLVDRQHKVVAVGNPFQNLKVQELYLKILSGNNQQASSLQTTMTSASIDKSVIDLGEFDWKVPQKVVFTLTNTGKQRLVIHDIVSSCGCASVDYPRELVEPGKGLPVTVTYQAEKPAYFNKTLTLHANIDNPIRVTIQGMSK